MGLRSLQMVLINVMTPAELVPLANGLAQSCISLARFIGTWPNTLARQASIHVLNAFYGQGRSLADPFSRLRSRTRRMRIPPPVST